MTVTPIDIARRRRDEQRLRKRYGMPVEHRPTVLRRLREDYPNIFGSPDKASERASRE